MEKITPDFVIRYRDNVTIVRLKAENLTNVLDVNRIGDELGRFLDEGMTRLVLDLKNVRYAGSAALGMLLALSNRVKQYGGKLVLSHPEHIQELLHISRTAKMFTTAPDPKAAIALLEA